MVLSVMSNPMSEAVISSTCLVAELVDKFAFTIKLDGGIMPNKGWSSV